MVDCLAGLQETDGKWVSKADKQSTEIVHTSFALLVLAGVDVSIPIKSTRKYSNEADRLNEVDQLEESYAEKNGKYADRFVEDCGDSWDAGKDKKNDGENKTGQKTGSGEKDFTGNRPETFTEGGTIQIEVIHLEQRAVEAVFITTSAGTI